MEIVDIYDKNRRKKGYTKEKHDAFLEDEYRIISEIWIQNSKGEFLIQQRATHKKQFGGWWYCTTGGVLAGESPVGAALREANEELGITLKKENATFYKVITEESVHFYIFLFRQEIEEILLLQSDEVQAVKWASADEILTMVKEGTFVDLDYYNDFFGFSWLQNKC